MSILLNSKLEEIDELCELLDLEDQTPKGSNLNKARRVLMSKITSKAIDFDSGDYFKELDQRARESSIERQERKKDNAEPFVTEMTEKPNVQPFNFAKKALMKVKKVKNPNVGEIRLSRLRDAGRETERAAAEQQDHGRGVPRAPRALRGDGGRRGLGAPLASRLKVALASAKEV